MGGFAAFNAFAAWSGAVALVVGGASFGEVIDARLPFDSLVLAGLALGAIVAVPLTLVAWSAFSGGPRTDDLALGAGLTLIGWIIGQIAVIQAFSPFQPIYLGVGGSFVMASHRVRFSRRSRATSLTTVGSIITAVGVGLVPHVVKNGLTVAGTVGGALLLGGLVLVVAGTAGAVRGRRRPSAIVSVGAVVVGLVAAVSIVAPGVAATFVPSTEITTDPNDLGLDYETATVSTSDGVELAAWYLRGSNGAGVVVMHGAGSTRSDVLDQSAAIARNGYSVLLLDARGHGDSGGTAMDFGWYGDFDIAAGTAFLAARPEVDSGRIGVVGFSMGGEEAIGAAAGDERIRAVVAEGATARRADDKAWLSDVYGWRGWLQEQVEAAQGVFTDYLTEASPPIALRSAVLEATATQFLLITAGEVADEAHAAAHLRRGASDRVTVWNVEGARHTGGYEADPDVWERRVVEFLEQQLR